jgi:hypothetical protein
MAARFTGLRLRESLLAIDSKIDAYDLITRRGILSSNLSCSTGNERLTVLQPASTTCKAPSGGGTMGRLSELRSHALRCRVLCDVSSYGHDVRWETHLRGYSVAGATRELCATVTAFPWASASAGARSCCPLAMDKVGWRRRALLFLGIRSGGSGVAYRVAAMVRGGS